MSFGWKRITANVWRLDAVWQVVQETPGQWRVYRGDRALLEDFAKVEDAMADAERLKKLEADLIALEMLRQEPPSVSIQKTEPAYWVERLMDIHPAPAEPRYVLEFCQSMLLRLQDDPAQYIPYMENVEAMLKRHCEYWALEGNRYATRLEKWLAGQGWRKEPPAVVIHAKAAAIRNRFTAPEED